MASSALRVILTVGSLNPNDGGPSRTVPELAASLMRHGVDARIVTCVTPGAANAKVDVPVVEVPYSSRRARAVYARPFLRAVVREATRIRADIVHDNGVWLRTNEAASLAARQQGMAYVVSPRGMLEPWSLNHRSLRKRLAWAAFQRRALFSAAMLHATSEQEGANLAELGYSKPIVVIPNGVDVPALNEARVWRERSTVRPRIALFLSRVHPKKGLLTLVDAWAAARPVGWRVIIAGPDEGGHRAEVEAAIRVRGLEGVFEFAGLVEGEQRTRLFLDASFFVLPTHSENFGIVVAEALAHALPVITTTAAPWEELITDRCGWWIAPDAEPLAAALREATRCDAAELEALGRRARSLAARLYSWDRVGSTMRAAYEAVLSRASAPRSMSTPASSLA